MIGCGLLKENGTTRINVQGQTGTATPLADAQDACPSPNCNGLVCTDQGLWAPPKTFGSVGFTLDQDSDSAGVNTSMQAYSLGVVGGIPDMLTSLGDGFPGPNLDRIITSNPNYPILWHANLCPGNDNDDECDLFHYGNTFSTFSLAFRANAGEIWRFGLWERAKFINTNAEKIAPAQPNSGPLTGTGWVNQQLFYIDRTGQSTAIQSVIMNDVSSHAECNTRWEYMITVQRLNPVMTVDSVLPNDVIRGTRQYRMTTNSAHCQLPHASSSNINNGPIAFFPA